MLHLNKTKENKNKKRERKKEKGVKRVIIINNLSRWALAEEVDGGGELNYHNNPRDR